MKTPMQSHIEDLNLIKQMVLSKKTDEDLKEAIIVSIEGCIENAENFLSKERWLIETTFNDGLNCNVAGATGEEYFNQTFK